MDAVLISVLVLGVGLLTMVTIALVGQVLLLMTLTAAMILDLGANLSAVLVGRPRCRRD